MQVANALLSFLQAAEGAPAGAAPSSPFSSMLWPLILILGIFWVVMIGPERKQRKKREEMLESLKKGDKVMLNSGLYAAVAQVQEDIVTLQVADGVRMRFNRSAVQAVLEDGIEKAGDKANDKGAAKTAE